MQSTIPIMDPVFHLFQDLKTKRVYKNGCPVSTMSKILPLLSVRQPMSENFLKRLFGLIQIQNLNENAIIIVCRKGWVLYNLQTISISLWWDYYDMLRNQCGDKGDIWYMYVILNNRIYVHIVSFPCSESFMITAGVGRGYSWEKIIYRRTVSTYSLGMKNSSFEDQSLGPPS